MGLTSDIWGNVGEVKSWGWDGSADLNYAINKDAWLTGRFNFTYAKNEVTEREEPAYRDEYRRTIGWPVRQQWGLIAERLFIDEADVANSPTQGFGTNVQPGDIKYKDINNDGIVNDNVTRRYLNLVTVLGSLQDIRTGIFLSSSKGKDIIHFSLIRVG